MKLARAVELDLGRQRTGRGKLSIRGRQPGRVVEADGVIIGEVGAEIGESGRNEVPADHANPGGPAEDAPMGDGPVVTAQAKFARTGGLSGLGVERG